MKFIGQERRTVGRRLFHAPQQVTMPRLAAQRAAIHLDTQPFENVFYASVERMERRSECAEFNFVWRGTAGLDQKRMNSRQQPAQLLAFGGLCLRNLSHPHEFILSTKITGKRRAHVQINQVHRPPEQITYARARAIKQRRRQAGNRKIKIVACIARPFGCGTEHINLPRAGSFEFGDRTADQVLGIAAHSKKLRGANRSCKTQPCRQPVPHSTSDGRHLFGSLALPPGPLESPEHQQTPAQATCSGTT
ncbi:MAG: hypothetical protein NZ739_11250 [Verrucomicrobiae bacterium]|nr:hypothetical protein [Verrucomicrobiae bacterium]